MLIYMSLIEEVTILKYGWAMMIQTFLLALTKFSAQFTAADSFK